MDDDSPSDNAAAATGRDRPRPAAHRPRPATRTPEPDGSGPTRRWFVVGGGLALLAGGAGVGAAFLHHDDTPARPRTAPAALVAAVAAERVLIADLDATTGGAPSVRTVVAQARADHAAHLQALEALAGQFDRPAASSTAPSTPAAPRGTPRTVAALRAAEQRASTLAAQHAGQLDGRTAALLASISACEATHAELFT